MSNAENADSVLLACANDSPVTLSQFRLFGERMIYRTKKDVQAALARLSAALPNMLKDADTFHDQFERQAGGIIRCSPMEFEDFIYQRLHALVLERGIKPRLPQEKPRMARSSL
jgi:hypothetical protein